MARMSSGERLAQAEECLASGMTVRDWCAANGVPAPTMYAWIRRLREEGDASLAPAFVEVAAGDGGCRAASPAPVVARVGAVEILLPPGFAEADAAAAMRAAASL